MIVLFLIIISSCFAFDPRDHVTVTLNEYNQIKINNRLKDNNYHAEITRIMLCATSLHSNPEISVKDGCQTEGYVQFQVSDKRAMLQFPHPDRLISRHFYAQVDLDIKNTNTGEIVKDTCVLRVPLQPEPNYVALVLSIVALGLVIGGVVVTIIMRNKLENQEDKINKNSDNDKKKYMTTKEKNKQLARRLNFYGDVEL